MPINAAALSKHHEVEKKVYSVSKEWLRWLHHSMLIDQQASLSRKKFGMNQSRETLRNSRYCCGRDEGFIVRK